MAVPCKTCPFKLNSNGQQRDPVLAATVTQRTLFKAQQVCHGTEGKNREAKNRCRGSYDTNVIILQRMGMEPEKNLENYVEPLNQTK